MSDILSFRGDGNKPTFDKVHICPTWLYKWKLNPSLYAPALTYCQNLDVWNNNEQNSASEDKKLFQLPELELLVQQINDCLEEVKKDLKLRCDYLRVCSMWANKAEYNQWHHRHWHGNSYASGILYLTSSKSETWFSREDNWSDQGFAWLRDNQDLEQLPLYKNSSIAGDLVIFSSHLHHSVSAHEGFSPRYSLAFNAFPCGNVGEFSSANGMYIPPF